MFVKGLKSEHRLTLSNQKAEWNSRGNKDDELQLDQSEIPAAHREIQHNTQLLLVGSVGEEQE